MVDEAVDDDKDEEPSMVLHVVDIQSSDILQSVRLDILQNGVSGDDSVTIIVDGDESYVADFFSSEVVVLRIAGSEA